MKRRTFLASAAGAASVALAGCSNESDPDEPERIPYAERYGSVVNLATAGAATDAAAPIDGILREAVADDTLVFFPPGRYRVDGAWDLPDFDHVGLIGPNATIVPPQGHSGYLFTVGRPGTAKSLRFEGFTFDFTAPGAGPRAIQARVDDDLIVRDVTVRGRQDTDTGVIRFDVTSPDGTGEVTRLRLPDGGKPGTVATGCLVGPASTGHLTFTDCHIAGFPDNGLYASPATGTVTVRGGMYANSGIANVRVSAPSLVEGVTVRCDRTIDGIPNMRGIRLRGGAGAVVRDCTVEFQAVTHSDGAIVLADMTGPARIENCTIEIHTDRVHAVRAKRPTSYTGREPPGVACRGVTVTGSAAGETAVEIRGRPGSRLSDLCVQQTGRGRNGILLDEARNSRVSGSIAVPGQRLILQDSPNVSQSLSPVENGC